MYHIVSDQRVMGSADKTKKLLNALENDERVYISTICPFSNKVIDDSSYAVAFAEKTNGIVYTQADFRSFGESEEDELIKPLSDSEIYTAVMLKTKYALSANKSSKSFDEEKYFEYMNYMRRNIVRILGEGIEKSNYTIISSTGLTEIKLDTVLRPEIYYEVKGVKPTDTDKDGLSDWDETDVEFIKHILTQRSKGISGALLKIIKNENLPTLKEYADNMKLDYVTNGYIKMKLYQDAYSYKDSMNIRLLPIYSSPVDADSDNDSIPDYCDKNKLYPHNIVHDLKTESGEKYIDTFEILKNLNLPIEINKKINCKIDVYSLPNSSSKKIHRYGNDIIKISVYSVVKSEDCYWLKIKVDNTSAKMGYIMWDETSLDDKNHRIRNIIDEFGLYHINLPFNRLYESGIGYGEQHIFKTNPEYQGFLMALSNTYDNLNIYRQKGYPINGFVFIGMSFAESGAGIDGKNYFGAKFTFDVNNEDEKILIETGKKAVVSAMLKCNLAFSSKDALDLLNEELFYQKAQDLISFLKRRIDECRYDISTNYSSYCIGVANTIGWEKNYLNGSVDAHDYLYINYSVSEIIEKIGPELASRCEVKKDGF